MIERCISQIGDFYCLENIVEEKLSETDNLIILILDKYEDQNFYNVLKNNYDTILNQNQLHSDIEVKEENKEKNTELPYSAGIDPETGVEAELVDFGNLIDENVTNELTEATPGKAGSDVCQQCDKHDCHCSIINTNIKKRYQNGFCEPCAKHFANIYFHRSYS